MYITFCRKPLTWHCLLINWPVAYLILTFTCGLRHFSEVSERIKTDQGIRLFKVNVNYFSVSNYYITVLCVEPGTVDSCLNTWLHEYLVR